MKLMRTIIGAVLSLALVIPALAACPIDGHFSSLYPDVGDYPMSLGRAAEAWCGGGAGMPGNLMNAQSWDGTALGLEWKIWGMEIDADGGVEIDSNIVNGTGWIDYVTNYVGGEFWLSGDREWSSDGEDLVGQVSGFNVATRVTYLMGEVAGATSNFYLTGNFDGCEVCLIQEVTGNTELDWRPGGMLVNWGPFPADYPDFLCPTEDGELFTVCCIDLVIACDVASETTTWGDVKSLFR